MQINYCYLDIWFINIDSYFDILKLLVAKEIINNAHGVNWNYGLKYKLFIDISETNYAVFINLSVLKIEIHSIQ